jgi:cell division protein FtsL
MNTEDISKQLTELQISIGAYRSENSAQNFITNNRLESIDNHLKTLNGKVASHEKRLNDADTTHAVDKANDDSYDKNRDKNCPQLQRIENLEKDKVVKLGVKQFLIGTVGIVSIMLGIAFTSVKIAEYYNNKNQQELIETIKQEINEDN